MKSSEGAGSGERLSELQRAFASLSPSVVLKADVFLQGIQPTRALRDAGRRAIGQFIYWGPGRGDDIHAEGDDSEWVVTPWFFRLPDDTRVKIRLSKMSPYQIQGDDGTYRLTCNGVPVTEVGFVPKPAWTESTTSTGQWAATLGQLLSEECLVLMDLRYCEFDRRGEDCGFCSLTPVPKEQQAQYRGFQTAIEPATAVEVFERAADEGRIRHVILSGGTITDLRREAEHHARFVKALRQVIDRRRMDCVISLATTALGSEEQRLLFDSGLHILGHNVEVWDARQWPVTLPGKTRLVGRDEWLRRLEAGTGIFGSWGMRTNVLMGLETVKPIGFEDEDAGIRSFLEGFEWCLDRQIGPKPIFWESTPGSRYEGKSRPSTEYYLRLAEGCHRLYERFGVYPKQVRKAADDLLVCHKCNSMAMTDCGRLAGKST